MVSLHNFVLVFLSSHGVYCHSNHRYTSSNNQKITLVCKNKDKVRQFVNSLFLQQDRTSLTVYLHVPVSAVYSMMVCIRIHPKKQPKFQIYCQATGTGPGDGNWELGIGNWELGIGNWEWVNGNGKIEMGNREYPYTQSQEMTV